MQEKDSSKKRKRIENNQKMLEEEKQRNEKEELEGREERLQREEGEKGEVKKGVEIVVCYESKCIQVSINKNSCFKEVLSKVCNMLSLEEEGVVLRNHLSKPFILTDNVFKRLGLDLEEGGDGVISRGGVIGRSGDGVIGRSGDGVIGRSGDGVIGKSEGVLSCVWLATRENGSRRFSPKVISSSLSSPKIQIQTEVEDSQFPNFIKREKSKITLTKITENKFVKETVKNSEFINHFSVDKCVCFLFPFFSFLSSFLKFSFEIKKTRLVWENLPKTVLIIKKINEPIISNYLRKVAE